MLRHLSFHSRYLAIARYVRNWKVVAVGIGLVLNITLLLLLGGGSFPPTANESEEYQASLMRLSQVPPTFGEIGKFFVQLAEEKGAVHAFEILKRAELPPNMDLHLLGHLVGDELYKQQGIEGMKYCTPDFRNACSHTVVIGALFEEGLVVFDKVNDVCKKAPGGRGAYTMCFHGLGHGVLAYAGYDVAKAVPLCARTATAEYGGREYEECVGGITMEMVSGIHDPALWEEQKKVYLPEGDPLALCRNDAIPERVKNMCYIYITPQLFRAAAGSNIDRPDPDTFEKAFSYCDQIPIGQSENRKACFGGFGKEFTVLAQDRDIRRIDQMDNSKLSLVYSWCRKAGSAEGENACLSNALDSLYWGGENDPDVSIRFCGILADGTDSDDCFEHLLSNVDHYTSDAWYQEQFCAALPEQFEARCRERLMSEQ